MKTILQNVKAAVVLLLLFAGAVSASASYRIYFTTDIHASQTGNTHWDYGYVKWDGGTAGLHNAGFEYKPVDKVVYYADIPSRDNSITYTLYGAYGGDSANRSEDFTIPNGGQTTYNVFLEEWYTFSPSVGLSANKTTMALGKSVTLTASYDQFVPAEYTYQYSTDNKNFTALGTVTSQTYAFTPTEKGTYYLRVTGNDGFLNATSGSVVTVSVVDPSVTLTPSVTSIDAGNEITLTASGATPSDFVPSSYTFYLSTDGGTAYTQIASGTSSTAKYTPTQKGTYLFKVVAVDGSVSATTTTSVEVNAVTPFVRLTVNPTSVNSGDPMTITATPVCCSPSKYYFYVKKGDRAFTQYQANSSNIFTFTPDEPGTYQFEVTAEDNGTWYDVKSGAVTAAGMIVSTSYNELHAWKPFTISETSVGGFTPSYLSYSYSTDGGVNYTYITDETCGYIDDFDRPLTLSSSMSFTPTAKGSYRLRVEELGGEVAYLDVTVAQTYQDITPNDAGVLSCVAAYPLDFSSVEGLKAYVATGVTASSIHLVSVDQVAQGEAFVVKGTPGTAYAVPTAPSVTHADGYTNLFQAADGAKAASEYGDNVYCLSTSGVYMQVASGVVIPAGKAYLVYSNPGVKAISLNFDDDEAQTAILSVNPDDASAPAYNLTGQRVKADAKGIVIMNGKKYLNR